MALNTNFFLLQSIHVEKKLESVYAMPGIQNRSRIRILSLKIPQKPNMQLKKFSENPESIKYLKNIFNQLIFPKNSFEFALNGNTCNICQILNKEIEKKHGWQTESAFSVQIL